MSLTKYPQGSIRELIALSFPLMLSALSGCTMVVADRWFLAQYTIEAHNAAVVATTLGWALIFGWIVLANIAEIFVAQYNGAGLKKQLGVPVWQMIWLSLGSVLFFIPMSLWGSGYFYGSPETHYENEYFRIMMLYGPFYPFAAALTGFFVGQGKTRLVTLVVIIGNVINVMLDNLLIFGWEGVIPSMGVSGAAIATSVSTIVQGVILFTAFFSKKHREEHGTTLWKFQVQSFLECVKVGLPNSIFMVCEISAFAVFYALMHEMGPSYITILGICQSMWILFSFVLEGMNKATATIVGNMIGAGKSYLVNKTIRAGIILNLFFLLFFIISFTQGYQTVIDLFLKESDAAFSASVEGSLRTCLLCMSFYMFFEGLRFLFSAVLLAAGDTLFLSIAGSSLVWVLMVAPTYFFVVRTQSSVESAFSLWIVYSVLACGVYYLRIVKGKWDTIVISHSLKNEVA